jgi:methionyl-tRNA formyltransferase
MGTPQLAATILERLIAASGPDFTVVGVVTRPDQPRKRGLRVKPSETAAVAERNRIRTLKPVKIRTAEFLDELKSFAPDLLVIAAYGRILPDAVLGAPALMPINVHASLLPRHRGAAPIEGAILAGDRESGVTIMRVTQKMDSGPILLQRNIAIAPAETQGTLKAKLADLGADALLAALAMLRRGELRETPQDESLATYTSPITKEQAVIDWQSPAATIERQVRAFDPWPVARTRIGSDELLIWRAAAEGDSASNDPSGTIIATKPNVLVQCGSGRLRLVEVQAPGRKRLDAAEFIRGRRIVTGTRLG